MNKIQKITPHFWFDTQAEEAAKFYTSIFKNSKIRSVARYVDEGQEIHGKSEGTIKSKIVCKNSSVREVVT